MFTKSIQGISYAKTDSRGEAFADNAGLHMERKEEYLQAALDYLEAFSKISGLICNLEKTNVMPIGYFDL